MVDFKLLSAPFPPAQVSWRVGAVNGDRGMALAFIDARDVADRLDSVCGPDGWQCRYSHVGAMTVCEIAVKVGDEWLWKADGSGQSDIEAEKGALSDSFKRAAVRWQIGRYLYHLPSPWVEIEKRGKTSIIKNSEYAKLEKILAQAGTPSPTRPTLPPPDQDVVDGAKRWVAQQIGVLNGFTKDEEIFLWDDKNERALHKLKLQHRNLWDELAEARLQALEALTVPV